MGVKQNIFQKRMDLLNLAIKLQNVSGACREMGVSRQYYYELRKTYQQQGIAALKEKDRKKPNLKNRVAPEVEKAVISFAYQYPSYGQERVAGELRKKGILVSSGGIRSIWRRHGMQTFQERFSRLKEMGVLENAVHPDRPLSTSPASYWTVEFFNKYYPDYPRESLF
ncbi:MAG: helix-turn-helix domain-containing protein [Nitrospiria bacterium]